jgi:hypothetical protein
VSTAAKLLGPVLERNAPGTDEALAVLCVEMSGWGHLLDLFALHAFEILAETQRRMGTALQRMRDPAVLQVGRESLVSAWWFPLHKPGELGPRAELTARGVLTAIAEPHPMLAGETPTPSVTWHPLHEDLVRGEFEFLGRSILLTSAADSAVMDSLAWLEEHDPAYEAFIRQLALGSMATIELSSWDIPSQRHVRRSSE